MRRISALLLLSLVATVLALVAPTAPAAGAQSAAQQAQAQEDWHDPGHTIAINDRGDGVVMALKSNGDLMIRRMSAGGSAQSWIELGRGDWAGGDVTIDSTGRVEIIGLKLSGALYTRSWTGGGVWGPWTRHGASTWDVNAPPSISTSGSRITLAAVKADGRLYTRGRGVTTSVKWGTFARHGRADWTQADIDMATDGTAWLIGTKADGRLYTRVNNSVNWGGWVKHGRDTWDPTTSPSISARTGAMIYGAVKEDGRLYTRTSNGSWAGYVRHGRANWTSVSLDMSSTGVIGLAATKDTGRLYTRVNNSVNWGGWVKHGRDNWSVTADPSISVGDGQTHILAAKAAGTLYSQSKIGASWGSYTNHGTDFDGGIAGTNPPPPPSGNEREKINSYVQNMNYDGEAAAGYIPGATGQAVQQSAPVEGAPEQSDIEPGVIVECTSTDYSLSENFDQVAILRATGDAIWPGALVKGNSSLRDGAPTPYVGINRGPITMRVENLPGFGDRGNLRVESPNNSRTSAEIDKALTWWNENVDQPQPDQSTYQEASSYTSEQLGIQAGLNVEWQSGEFNASFNHTSTEDTYVLTQTYKQTYYNVVVDSPAPADFFAPGTTAAQVQQVLDADDAPAYVSSVSYGRILMVRMETSRSVSDTDASLALEWAVAGADVNADLAVQHQKIINRSQLYIVSIGGNAEVNSRLYTDLDEFSSVITSGSNYSEQTPGIPIAYQVRYLKDNELAKLGYTTDYTATTCDTYAADDDILVKIIRVQVLEDCDGVEGWGEFDFRVRVYRGFLGDDRHKIGSDIELYSRQFSDADHITDSYENILQNRTFSVGRTDDRGRGGFFGVQLEGWEEDKPFIGAAYYDDRMDRATAALWHVYQPDSGEWQHPSYSSTGLGGTYPNAFQVLVGEVGCKAELHYMVRMNGVWINPNR